VSENTTGSRFALPHPSTAFALKVRDLPVLESPEPQVVVTALGESGVAVELRVWVADPLAPASSRFRLLEVAKRALDEAGIEIPFPQRVVRLVEGRDDARDRGGPGGPGGTGV